ncbi:unnamed protein product, partial [Meganyctiphanes norvegica]|uniref:C2H2-type domain-containing protein n=1 Tax=Meganyctiphanes norvegica TaxID=48144 RepID=A0AAV2RLI2_MEGNR
MVPMRIRAPAASDKESFSVLQFLEQEIGGDDLRDAHAVPVICTDSSRDLQDTWDSGVNGVKGVRDKGTSKVLQKRIQNLVEAHGCIAKERAIPVSARSFKDLLFHEDNEDNYLSKANINKHTTDSTNDNVFQRLDEIASKVLKVKREATVLHDDIWSSHDDDCSATAPAHINPYITTENTCQTQVCNADDNHFHDELIGKDLHDNYFAQTYTSVKMSKSTYAILPYAKQVTHSDIDNVTQMGHSGLPEHFIMRTKDLLNKSVENIGETVGKNSNYKNHILRNSKCYNNDNSFKYMENKNIKYNDIRYQKQIIKFRPKKATNRKRSNINKDHNDSNEYIVGNKMSFSRNTLSMINLDSNKNVIDSQNSFLMKPESLLSFEDLSEIVKEEVIKDINEDTDVSFGSLEDQLNKKTLSVNNKKSDYNKVEGPLCEAKNETVSRNNETESDNFVCNVCGYKCKHKDIFANHMSSHNLPSSKIYSKERKMHECPVCGYKCMHKSIFINHMASHKITDTYLKFGCKLCNFRCNFRRSLKQHSINHDSKKMFTCTECDYKNTSTKQFHEHITCRGHKVFKCSICNETFNCHKDYSEHKKVHPPRKCPECGKLFNSKFRLDRHLQYESGDNKFECVYCKQNFTSRCLYKIHIMNHKTRPFHCSLCDQKFTRIDNLKSHIQRHNDQKPFSCLLCNKTYTKKAYLIKHILGNNH